MSGLVSGALLSALVSAFVAGMVGHGVLRPMLEARGVSPWTVRDSLGAMPFVLLGSAALGASGSLAAGWLSRAPEAIMSTVHAAALLAAGAGVLAITGLLLLRLGLLALRKLT